MESLSDIFHHVVLALGPWFLGLYATLASHRDQIMHVLNSYETFAIVYVFIGNTSYLIILVFGYLNAKRLYTKSQVSLGKAHDISHTLMPVSLLIPAYNEELTIHESIKSMLRSNYPQFELIVVNDGSTDSTMECLITIFELECVDFEVPQRLQTKPIRHVYKSRRFPTLTVIDKDNGGKADALNCAINYSIYPLVCCVDSDSIFEEDGLIQLATPFFEYQDEVVAVGGSIRVANGVHFENGKPTSVKAGWNYLALIQIVEYLRAFLVGRMGWDFIQANTIISGAFCLFRKKSVIEVGGYSRDTIGEDLELLLKMHMHYKKSKTPYRVKFLPNPVCWTEVPTDLKTLGNQRSRWQQGLAEGLKRTRPMLFRPWSGVIGWIALPYLWLFELASAPIELLGYVVAAVGVMFGLLEPKLAFSFLVISVVYGWILTFGAVLIEELTFRKYKSTSDYIKLCLSTILEQAGFRQLHLYWRIRGVWRYLMKNQSWGKMKRAGFLKPKA